MHACVFASMPLHQQKSLLIYQHLDLSRSPYIKPLCMCCSKWEMAPLIPLSWSPNAKDFWISFLIT